MRWTSEEKAILIDKYSITDIDILVKILGRKPKAIRAVAQRMGLKKGRGIKLAMPHGHRFPDSVRANLGMN
jgi:hypothetical protein